MHAWCTCVGGICVCICPCMCEGQQSQLSTSMAGHIIFWKKSSHWTWNSLISETSLLMSFIRGYIPLTPSLCWVYRQTFTLVAFMWCWGAELKSSWLPSGHFTEPSPYPRRSRLWTKWAAHRSHTINDEEEDGKDRTKKAAPSEGVWRKL